MHGTALFLSLLLLGCGAGSGDASRARERAADPPPARVHWYASGEAGIFANAYLIEGPDGVVAIDATLTVATAGELRGRLDRLGKPLRAVLLTHGHPDHYNGAAILTRGDRSIPIVATAGVDKVIRAHDAAKEAQWRPVFGDQWPRERRLPDRTTADGEVVRFAGLELEVRDLGPGESHHDSIWLLRTGDGRAHAFVGDLLFHGVHSYTADGHTGAWLANLDRLEREWPDVVLHPGHGASPAPRDLIARQRRYLDAYRRAVARLARGGALDEEAERELTREMTAQLGSDRLAFLVGLGADAVAAELAAVP